MYYLNRGEWPTEIDELERSGQLDISRSTKLKWTFDIQLSGWGGRITATSTEEMPGGAGHQVIYDGGSGRVMVQIIKSDFLIPLLWCNNRILYMFLSFYETFILKEDNPKKVSLDLKGENLNIFGPSGSGKSSYIKRF